jgi:acylphosphatase
MAAVTQTLARRYRISGRVQGVGFRYFVYHWATQLQVRGYVKNLADGDVEVYAVGSGVQLEGLREKLETGPALGRVTHFEEVPANIDTGFVRFHIEGD